MLEEVTFPTNTLEELSNKHHLSEEEAVTKFLEMSFHDSEKVYFNKLKVRLPVRCPHAINAINIYLKKKPAEVYFSWNV